MADISKISIPGGETYDFKDASAVESVTVSGSKLTVAKRDGTSSEQTLPTGGGEYLPLSGGTVDTLTIGPRPETLSGSFAIVEDVVKGTTPEVNKYASLWIRDNTGGDLNIGTNGLAMLDHAMLANGYSMWDFCVLGTEAGSTDSTIARIRLGMRPNGTGFAEAPHPASTSNSANIATTKWVREYVASLDGTGVSY